jgi:glycosyltransferase involved in cell wall biosynthesis
LQIALDATYSVGDALSGVGVYSREILSGAAASGPGDKWEWYYRSQRYWRARRMEVPKNVTRRFLADGWGSRSADLFHGLNQRLPRRRFRRQIATFHDLFVMSGDYSTREFRERFTAQARDAAAGADIVIAVSAFTGRQVQQLLGFPSARIRVIHHGVVPRAIPDVARENIVLCVGAIQRRKNQVELVRAFRAMPANWRLVLAGSSGYEAGETMAEIERSPCASRIQVTGYLSEADIADWYGRARIFAFPSLDEGFGMPVLEAMMAGLPVVTSNRSAMPEVAGNAAVLVDPDREDELATTLAVLAADEARQQCLATLGRNHAARFTWARAVDATLEVYRELSG